MSLRQNKAGTDKPLGLHRSDQDQIELAVMTSPSGQELAKLEDDEYIKIYPPMPSAPSR